MTQHEQIKEYLRRIRYATTPGKILSLYEITSKIQEGLDAIKDLLESEPETLAASVLRLTNICNELGRENALLRNDLTEMTLDLNAAEKHAASLKLNLKSARSVEESRRISDLEQARSADKCYIESLKQKLVTAKLELNIAERNLRAAAKHAEQLKTDLEHKNDDLDAAFRNNNTLRSILAELRVEIERKNEILKYAHSNLVWFKKGYEEDLVDTVALAAHRKKLLAEAKERIEALEEDLKTDEAYVEKLRQELLEAKEEIACKNDLIKALEQRLAVVERDRAYARTVNPWSPHL